MEYLKAAMCAKVEHPCCVITRQFGYLKVSYGGLAKNTAQMFTLFALSHLWMAPRRLLGWDDVRNARKARIGEDRRRQAQISRSPALSGAVNAAIAPRTRCPTTTSVRGAEQIS